MIVGSAWLTAMLTATGYHDPKKFPKSPSTLLSRSKNPQPFNKAQWEAAIKMILGDQVGVKSKKPKKKQRAQASP